MKVNVTIPVYNEEIQLARNVRRLLRFLRCHGKFQIEIIIADNGSNDETLSIAKQLTLEERNVEVLHLDCKGRGRAVKTAWLESSAEIVSYMDVDLSSDLEAFPRLIESVVGGGFDLAIGSRLLEPHSTLRGLDREFISRCYNWLIRFMVDTGFSDAQCGFKAAKRMRAISINDRGAIEEIDKVGDTGGKRELGGQSPRPPGI